MVSARFWTNNGFWDTCCKNKRKTLVRNKNGKRKKKKEKEKEK